MLHALLLAAATPAIPLPLSPVTQSWSRRITVPTTPPNDYAISSFGYTDPNEAEFNVLGGGATSLLRQDESILIPYAGTFDGVRREDRPGNYADNAAMNHGGSPGLAYDLQDAGMGDLLGDGKQRAVTASRVVAPGNTARHDHLLLRVWESEGQPNLFPILELETAFPVADETYMAIGDVDGDGRDEVVLSVQDLVSGRTRALVVDDAVDGDWTSGAPLVAIADDILSADLDPMPIACGQFDRDAAEEVCALRTTPTTQTVRLLDDATRGLALLGVESYSVSIFLSAAEGAYVVPFDHDGDGIDVVGSYWKERLYVARYDADSGSFQRFGNSRSIDSPAPISLTAVDRAGDGHETLAFIDVRVNETIPLDFYEVEIDEVEFSSGGAWTGRNLSRLNVGFRQVIDTALVALDDDADGREELRAAVGRTLFGAAPDIYEFNYDDVVLYTKETPVAYDFVPGDRRLALVAGDDDGESVVVRWTGEKYPSLSQPMPIALMEAVPTKSGISQNYVASGSSFTLGATGTTSFATTSGTTVSGTVGVSSPSLFEDVFGASTSTTITSQVARTTGAESSVRSFVTYTAAADAHTIVFQGTLYTSYVYEVVRARPQHPTAVGTLITINVPVATGAWKWELDFFNQVFPQGAIDPALAFGHASGTTVIGDPASYVSRAELQGYVQGAGHAYDGWIGGETNVGQGGGSVTFGLELGTQTSTTTERTVGVETTGSVQVGPYSMGGSVGLTDGQIYTVATAQDTSYSATLGDIASQAEWTDWKYAAGMVIYQERSAFFAPVQVMRYWVDPFGPAYP
ncbi:MAG: hypothetical protein AAGB93_06775 [Planctomycetota bacterium]